jgi:hypothetical protein
MKPGKAKIEIFILVGIALLSAILYNSIFGGVKVPRLFGVRFMGKSFVFPQRLLFVVFFLVIGFFTYFIREYKYKYKRTGWNLLVILSGLSVMFLAFVLAKHFHELSIQASGMWGKAPTNMPLDVTQTEDNSNPAPYFKRGRNALLLLDVIVFACLAYLWYFWAEVPVKRKSA